MVRSWSGRNCLVEYESPNPYPDPTPNPSPTPNPDPNLVEVRERLGRGDDDALLLDEEQRAHPVAGGARAQGHG